MAIVVPTVLASTPDEYGTMIARAEQLSPRVHVDIGDGRFTPHKTIGLAQVHTNEATKLDLHLMLQEPVAELETAISLKPQLIIFHAESNGDLAAVIQHVQELGIRAGIAILPQTSVESAQALIKLADHVLIFTGQHIGYSSGELQLNLLERAAQVRAIKSELEISVDGGANDQNAASIVQHGVDVLYVGAFLQAAKDPEAAFASIARQAAAPAEAAK